MQHIPESRVRIFVVANLQLVPSTAYILQHATVTYVVELLKQGRVHGQQLFICCFYYYFIDVFTFGWLVVAG